MLIPFINSLLPLGRYINMDPYPHRVAYILDLVHLIWTILFFAESVLTSYNFLASLQIIFNLKHGHLKILDNFLSIIYYLFSAGES